MPRLSDPIPVKSSCGVKGAKRVVVGTIQTEIFDSLQDAVQFFGGEPPVLELVNTQHATNKKNDARRVSNTKVSEKKLVDEATRALSLDTDVLTMLLNTPAEARESAMQAEINKKVEELRAKYDAARQAAVGAAPTEADEDDEDDAADE